MRAGLVVALWLTACNNPAAQAADTPAVLIAVDPAARAALTAAVSELLQGAQVTLPTEVLLHDSWFTVERARVRRADGQLLNGRILERPEQFQLIKAQHQCVLVQRGSGRRRVLSALACRAF